MNRHKYSFLFQGWGGPKVVHGEFIEGSFRSHQVPLAEAKKDAKERKMLQDWLLSYNPKELFGETGVPNDDILSIIPQENALKLGQKKEAYASYEPLDVPNWQDLAVEKGTEASCMKMVGEFLHDVIQQ